MSSTKKYTKQSQEQKELKLDNLKEQYEIQHLKPHLPLTLNNSNLETMLNLSPANLDPITNSTDFLLDNDLLINKYDVREILTFNNGE